MFQNLSKATTKPEQTPLSPLKVLMWTLTLILSSTHRYSSPNGLPLHTEEQTKYTNYTRNSPEAQNDFCQEKAKHAKDTARFEMCEVRTWTFRCDDAQKCVERNEGGTRGQWVGWWVWKSARINPLIANRKGLDQHICQSFQPTSSKHQMRRKRFINEQMRHNLVVLVFIILYLTYHLSVRFLVRGISCVLGWYGILSKEDRYVCIYRCVDLNVSDKLKTEVFFEGWENVLLLQINKCRAVFLTTHLWFSQDNRATNVRSYSIWCIIVIESSFIYIQLQINDLFSLMVNISPG